MKRGWQCACWLRLRQRAAVESQDLGSHVSLSVPLPHLDEWPGLALAGEHKRRRAVADDQRLIQGMKVRRVEGKVILHPLFVVPADVTKDVPPRFIPRPAVYTPSAPQLLARRTRMPRGVTTAVVPTSDSRL